MPLPAPLTALEQFSQFVAVRLTPDPKRPGKTSKLPINPRTLGAASSTDPATWGTYAEAAATGLPVGFVLTESDPLWCLDIDGQLHDGAVAASLITALPGAAVEVSQSGTGLHIWGCGSLPAHGCKNTALGLELYHTGRFMCLGEPTSATGNAWQDFTAHLTPVIATYFPPSAGSDTPSTWTNEPRAEWNGSTDDRELIRRARESQSAASVFGNRASFEDLWSATESRLAVAYPSTAPGAAWGYSEADRALAQHLAFWTGCNCGRMHNLMLQSALKRDKWDREDYLRRTILSAVADCRDVCQDTARPVAEVAEEARQPGGGERRDSVTWVNAFKINDFFHDCVYIESQHRAYVPGHPAPVKPDTFRVLFGGYFYGMDETGEKYEKDAWQAFTQSPLVRPLRAADATFRPDLAPGALVQTQGSLLVNTWLPAAVDCVQGDVSRFEKHLALLLPNSRDRAILVAYMAAIVQYPGRKFAWAPFIQGAEGNGKTMISHVIREAVGHQYTSIPTTDQIGEKFNSWMHRKLFAMVEDCHAGRGLMGKLKPMITGTAQDIELKGVDAVSSPVCINFIFNSNHRDGAPKGQNDRRICPLFTAQQSGADVLRDMGGEYFTHIWHWLEHEQGFAKLTYWLRHYDIPAELDPTRGATRAPDTSSTVDAIAYGLGAVEQEILEAVEQGRTGFRGDWISSHWLDDLLKEIRKDIHRTKRKEIVERMGYVTHPALSRGRVNNIIAPDGCKPRLYVRVGSPALSCTDAAEVARLYVADQMGFDTK